MSVIRVDNFGPSAGGTTYSATGVAKAWVKWSQDPSLVTYGSLNLSSITDNGTGLAQYNWTSSFDNSNYSAQGMTVSYTNTEGYGATVQFRNSGTYSTSALQVLTSYGNTGSIYDFKVNATSIFGDLA